MSIRVNPLGPTAAEIVGLDCARPLTDQAFQVVEFAFLDYPVLVFRDQILSATEVARFGRRFGLLEGYAAPAIPVGSKAETPKRAIGSAPPDRWARDTRSDALRQPERSGRADHVE